jgi:hypothetical protein
VIPDDLRELVEKQPGHVRRDDPSLAEAAIASLGVPVDGQFAEFFRTYRITAYHSPSSNEELSDVAEPGPEIAQATWFIRDTWQLPERYVCLTSCEGEGAYLYDRTDGSVCDFSLADREAFLSGEQTPQWRDFYAFMKWYLGGQ